MLTLSAMEAVSAQNRTLDVTLIPSYIQIRRDTFIRQQHLDVRAGYFREIIHLYSFMKSSLEVVIIVTVFTVICLNFEIKTAAGAPTIQPSALPVTVSHSLHLQTLRTESSAAEEIEILSLNLLKLQK